MALDFSVAQTDNTVTLDNFLGVDYNTFETETDLRRSKLAKNMIVNQNGYVEKRTGYKRVFENEKNERINGIFTYHAKYSTLTSDDVIIEDINIIHIGDALYKFHFDDGNIVRDEELLTGLKNKKTRAFEFGGAMYIIGAGFVKVCIDKLTRMLVCAFVSKIATEVDDSLSNVDLIVEERTPGKLNGKINRPDPTKTYKAISYKIADGKTKFDTDDMFLIGEAEETYAISISAVYGYFEDDSQYHFLYEGSIKKNYCFTIKSTEENGKHIKLNGYVLNDKWKIMDFVYMKCDTSTTNYDLQAYAEKVTEIVVVFTVNDMVYSPLIVNNRTPIWITEMDAVDNSDVNTRYTGQSVEGVNFANGSKAIQFYYSRTGKTTEMNAVRLYLLAGKTCNVNKIEINGYVWDYMKSGDTKINLRASFVDIDYSQLKEFSECTITVYFTTDEDEYDDIIDNCNIFGVFGGDNDTRVFLSGNPEYPCRDFASGLYDGTYFSDTMWTDVGGDNSRIIGYHKLYSNQIIVKDGNGESATQYLRSYQLDSDGKALYTLSQGNDSYSANCISSFKNIGGYPFYIGEDGFYMMYGTNVKTETNTACKSLLINKKFTAEDTANMICIAHEGRYYAYIKNQMYVCDTLRDYEWYYFDGLPDITCLWIYDDLIYFGDTSGKVYRFMKESEAHAYCDDVALDGSKQNAKSINALWTIPQNMYGSYTNYKTVRNLHLSCMPYDRSSVTVYYNSDEELGDEVLRENIDMFSFFNMDFGRFSFVTIDAPQAFATRVKLKNVFTFGMTLENNAMDEPFGFIGLTLTYREGKKVK